MRNILVIADLGHASPRIPGIMGSLDRDAWNATVVTPAMDDHQRSALLPVGRVLPEIVETSGFRMEYQRRRSIASRLVRRVRRMVGTTSSAPPFPDGHVDWAEHVLPVIRSLHASVPYALVFSSSSPVSTHAIARDVARELQIPWIADLRDLWSQNHAQPYAPEEQLRHRDLEVQTLSGAAALVTVTPQWRDRLSRLHRNPAVFIPNGFYRESQTEPAHAEVGPTRTEPRTAVYTGRIYPGFQDISPVLTSFSTVNRDRVRIRLAVYGPSCRHVADVCRRVFGATPEWLLLKGVVPREESYKVQRQADLLLLLNWEDAEDPGVAATKLYEYLPTSNPILAAGGHGNDFTAGVLRSTGAGVYCEREDEIAAFLSSYVSGTAELPARNETEIAYYSYAQIASRMERLFERVLEGDEISQDSIE